MTVRIDGAGPGLHLTFWGGGGVEPDHVPVVGSSVSLPVHGDAARTAEIVLYAANPGAFVDLAADLAVLTGTALHEFLLDRHLDGAFGPARPTDPGRVLDASVVDQAMGVLLDRGWTPEQARRGLRRRATDGDLVAAAEALLADLARGVGGWWTEPP